MLSTFWIVILASAAAVVAVMLAQREKARRAKNRQVLSKAVCQVTKQPPIGSRKLVSRTTNQMETLLDDIRRATDVLVRALAIEEGVRVDSGQRGPQALQDQIREKRIASEKAQADYSDSVERYREFVASLAPPLRASAAQRGIEVMTLAPILGNYVLTVPTLRELRDQRRLVACH